MEEAQKISTNLCHIFFQKIYDIFVNDILNFFFPTQSCKIRVSFNFALHL
jgi:hypothetical protein